MAVGLYFTIIKTTDGGETWNSIEPPTSSDILSINFFSEDEGVIVGENTIIFRTTTGGLVKIPEPKEFQRKEPVWSCYPNPFHERTVFSSSMAISGDVSVRIFDGMGRQVRSLRKSSNFSITLHIFWDGKDDSGCPVAPGIYIICLNFSPHSEAMRIIKF